MLEQRVAIGKRAVGGGKPQPGIVLAIKRLHHVDAFAHFHAIRANVLNRRGAHGAGNQRQILQARQAMTQGPQHEVMPHHPGIGAYMGGVAVIVQQANPVRGQRQHRRRRVTGKQQVAAPPQQQQVGVAQHRVAKQFG